MAERTDYVLGANVTEQAKAREGRATSVVSIRLADDEMSALAAAAEQEDKSLSQVVREALARRGMATHRIVRFGGIILQHHRVGRALRRIRRRQSVDLR
ncbi:MAG: ribbon-helix-helix protein, CopG family [Dehalococcoidia bacterium]|nr:ribbon-helix-helix protein, CopG family [Dehalococcoidia bacterium]